MFWDRVAWAYDLFANGMNRKANRALCAAVEKLIAPTDEVLECACGTGLLTGVIAGKCARLVATDFSANMLRRAAKKCEGYGNVTFEQADILQLNFPDERFDTVVAANVIHLLDDPYRTLAEMNRVCKAGGRIIIPTYMNQTEQGTSTPLSGVICKTGVHFRRAFTPDSYRSFLADAGYERADLILCAGRIPCAVAVLRKEERTMRHEGSDA